MLTSQKHALVVSAHSADFVWRAGGAIAWHVKQGWKVKVICLSYGERGESAKLWRQTNMTLEKVKSVRQNEAERAANILGSDIEFWDIGDYPLQINNDILFRLVDLYRTLQPEFVLSHSLHDPYNFDHPRAMQLAQEARIIAQAEGHHPGEQVLGAPPIYAFEPHQPEQCQWEPNTFLDISDVWDTKLEAIKCMEGQEHLWEYYTRVAQQRGVQAKRNIGITNKQDIRFAEGYMKLTPSVVSSL